jgi:hypothetical protein
LGEQTVAAWLSLTRVQRLSAGTVPEAVRQAAPQTRQVSISPLVHTPVDLSSRGTSLRCPMNPMPTQRTAGATPAVASSRSHEAYALAPICSWLAATLAETLPNPEDFKTSNLP